MKRRAALILALLAALHGAPSPLLAAPPNRLAMPTAAPRAGSSGTAFHLSVQYVSSGGNPARRVVAHAGPGSVDLALVSGTALDGTWAGELQLPAGTWSVTFRAVVDRGPKPTIAGPTLTVTPPAGPTPSADASVDQPPPDGSAAPGPGHGPRKGEGGAARSPAPATGGDDGQAPPAGGATAGDGRGQAPAATRREARPAASEGADRVPRDPGRETSQGGVDAVDAGPGAREVDDLLLVLGIVVGVAAVALLMTGWLLAARTRDDEERRAAAAQTTRAARARRRARAAGHDPVLAAMGLDGDDASQPDPDG